jgi:hypothetical protein
MSEQIYKLSPHRDLQCYFYMPSAIAAMSGATADGFTLSGTWRQQFDWAVVEWNRDNVFEHPSLRYLPDGDLSALQLTYQETRANCIPFESSLYPTVDWPSLRIWADDGSGSEQIYYVSLMEHATPVAGSYQPAQATMALTGTVTAGDVICICMPTESQSGYTEQHYSYQLKDTDTLASAAAQLANIINTQSLGWTATSSGASITMARTGGLGENGNRITVYGTVSAASTVSWANSVVTLSGGTFPATYQVVLNFGSLAGYTQPASVSGQTAVQIPTTNIRKMRWTWAPDLQPGGFVRTPFTVSITNWAVSGAGRSYFVAGPGSREPENRGQRSCRRLFRRLDNGCPRKLFEQHDSPYQRCRSLLLPYVQRDRGSSSLCRLPAARRRRIRKDFARRPDGRRMESGVAGRGCLGAPAPRKLSPWNPHRRIHA